MSIHPSTHSLIHPPTQSSIHPFLHLPPSLGSSGSIGMIPWVCVCSYAGSALKSIEDISMNRISQSHRTVTYISYGVGIVCTAIVVLTISWYTRRAFHHVVAQQTRIQAERISTTALVETKEQEGGESPLPQTTMPLSAS